MLVALALYPGSSPCRAWVQGLLCHKYGVFNGALIRTLVTLGMGACLTPVANNGDLLAKLTPHDRLLYVAMSITYRLKFASKTNHTHKQ